MADSNQIRINELARELEVKAKVLIDFLPEIGVTEKKTHSSSLDLEHAELARKHFAGLAAKEAAAEAEKQAKATAAKKPRRASCGCAATPAPPARKACSGRAGECCASPLRRSPRRPAAIPGTPSGTSCGNAFRTCAGRLQRRALIHQLIRLHIHLLKHLLLRNPAWLLRRLLLRRPPRPGVAPSAPRPGVPLRPCRTRPAGRSRCTTSCRCCAIWKSRVGFRNKLGNRFWNSATRWRSSFARPKISSSSRWHHHPVGSHVPARLRVFVPQPHLANVPAARAPVCHCVPEADLQEDILSAPAAPANEVAGPIKDLSADNVPVRPAEQEFRKAEPGKPLYARKPPASRGRPLIEKRYAEGERKLHPVRTRAGAGAGRTAQAEPVAPVQREPRRSNGHRRNHGSRAGRKARHSREGIAEERCSTAAFSPASIRRWTRLRRQVSPKRSTESCRWSASKSRSFRKKRSRKSGLAISSRALRWLR